MVTEKTVILTLSNHCSEWEKRTQVAKVVQGEGKGGITRQNIENSTARNVGA